MNISVKLKIALGAISHILFTCFVILSSPVYLFRQVAILLAKVFRSDLGDILNGVSSGLSLDLMAETPPRSNCVNAWIFEGRLTFEEVRSRVLKNWISAVSSDGKPVYDNFQRYPTNWLGFTFWKDASTTFSIDNHVLLFSKDTTIVTDNKITEVMGALLNEPFPRHQSPWKLVVVENYLHPKAKQEPGQPYQPHSVLIFKWHHCMVDGVGLLKALVNGLFQQPCDMVLEKASFPSSHMSIPHKILSLITFPVLAFLETSNFLSYIFRDSAFKVPDETKKWHQGCAKTEPIPIQVIKNIKNKFGVSYCSVLVSAVSSAVHKTLVNLDHNSSEKSMLCMNVLPHIGSRRRKIFANQMTGAVFDLPTGDFENPGERLLLVNKLLEGSRNSVFPILGQWYSSIIGNHPACSRSWIRKNRMIPIGLSNFHIPSHGLKWDTNAKWIGTEAVIGGHCGVTGVVICSMSHGKDTDVHVSAERSLMTEKHLQVFVKYINEEIDNLQNMSFYKHSDDSV